MMFFNFLILSKNIKCLVIFLGLLLWLSHQLKKNNNENLSKSFFTTNKVEYIYILIETHSEIVSLKIYCILTLNKHFKVVLQ